MINHIILPPQIPASEDHDSAVNQELAGRLIQAAQSIRDHASSECLLGWERLLSGLKASRALNSEGHLGKATLLDRLRTLPSGTSLILHVSEQNAGILVYRQPWSVLVRVLIMPHADVVVMPVLLRWSSRSLRPRHLQQTSSPRKMLWNGIFRDLLLLFRTPSSSTNPSRNPWLPSLSAPAPSRYRSLRQKRPRPDLAQLSLATLSIQS